MSSFGFVEQIRFSCQALSDYLRQSFDPFEECEDLLLWFWRHVAGLSVRKFSTFNPHLTSPDLRGRDFHRLEVCATQVFPWIPACAGMTGCRGHGMPCPYDAVLSLLLPLSTLGEGAGGEEITCGRMASFPSTPAGSA